MGDIDFRAPPKVKSRSGAAKRGSMIAQSFLMIFAGVSNLFGIILGFCRENLQRFKPLMIESEAVSGTGAAEL